MSIGHTRTTSSFQDSLIQFTFTEGEEGSVFALFEFRKGMWNIQYISDQMYPSYLGYIFETILAEKLI